MWDDRRETLVVSKDQVRRCDEDGVGEGSLNCMCKFWIFGLLFSLSQLGLYELGVLDASKPRLERNSAFERNKAYTHFCFSYNRHFHS